MHKLILAVLLALTSMVIATTDDCDTFLVHTDDVDRLKDIDIKPFVDFADSLKGKALSADGKGLNFSELYFQDARNVLNDGAYITAPTETSTRVSQFNGTVDKRANSLTCYDADCVTNRAVSYEFLNGMSALFGYACGWISGHIDDDWKTKGLVGYLQSYRNYKN